MSDHSRYDQERERRKLEEQRKEALRRAKTQQDREALNAFYDNRAKANKRRGGKPDTCMVTLVAMAGGAVGAVWLAAEGVRWVL